MNIFKRPATHYGKSPEPETPYQKAAQVWDERIGSARVQAKNWRYHGLRLADPLGGLRCRARLAIGARDRRALGGAGR
jgi:hypothetical protein